MQCIVILVILKTQLGLLVILLLAMADYIFGAFYGPRDEKAVAKGFPGMSGKFLDAQQNCSLTAISTSQ